jgi:DNA-binding CsgD family transcriptional regulator
MKETVGFIGLGGMGSRMAGRLLAAGYDLTVYNRGQERTHLLAQRGAKVAATPGDNGTFHNGRRISECRLAAGDVLHLAEIQLDVMASSSLPTIPDMEWPTPLPVRSEPATTVSEPAEVDGILSPSELRVLRLLLKGLSEKQTAVEVHLSWHTVHSHAKKIYRALGVHSRAELMSRFVKPIDAAINNRADS